MKTIFIVFVSLYISGCAAIGVSFDKRDKPIINNYGDLNYERLEKKTEIFCDFKRISEGLAQGELFCTDIKSPDYVSSFVSFSYYGSGLTPRLYMANLAKSFEADGLSFEKMYIKNFSPEPNKLYENYSFRDLVPSSFAVASNGHFAVFLGADDVFLRKIIYPSLRISGLEPKDKNQKDRLISDYNIKYSVFPHVVSADYLNNRLTKILGVPLFDIANKTFNDDEDKMLDYFKNLDNISLYSSPFLYKDEIAKMKTKELIPALPDSGEGYANESLPSYKLSKIEIVKIKEGHETILETYDSANIAALFDEKTGGRGLYFSSEMDNKSTIAIKFTHIAQIPRYTDNSLLMSNVVGLEYIYSVLGYKEVTYLKISQFYDLKDLPVDCIKKANIEKFLFGANLSKENIKKYMQKYTDEMSSCTMNEQNIAETIFAKDIDNGVLIK